MGERIGQPGGIDAAEVGRCPTETVRRTDLQPVARAVRMPDERADDVADSIGVGVRDERTAEFGDRLEMGDHE